MLKIAIPNKGRLSEKIYDLLNCAGLSFPSKDERTLQVTTYHGQYSIIFVRTQDIPRFVQDKVADVGFPGWDNVVEQKSEVDKLLELDFGYCEMVVAVKEEDSYKTSKDLPKEVKVATSFPNIAKEYFEKLGKNPKIIGVSGATEITPRLGLSDVIVDITSTGSTIKSNQLRIIDKILTSSAVVIARKDLDEQQKTQVKSLLRALNSVIDAREKKYLMANVPKSALPKIKEFLPGLSAPTVTTLFGDDSSAVIHVVVDADKVYESIEQLKALGGSGILIMTVDQMVR